VKVDYAALERDRLLRHLIRVLNKERQRRLLAAHQQWLTERPCKACGKSCGYGGTGRGLVYCSKECARTSEAPKAAKRISKARRRKQIRGTESEAIDPLKVFWRDKWKCQQCGRKTPQRLRGTYDDAAPEMDHIITLADGGPHTWVNVQCLCRACNQAKGGRSQGQGWLAGFAGA